MGKPEPENTASPKQDSGLAFSHQQNGYFWAVSRAMVESECIMPALSDMVGDIAAEVSAPEVVPFFSQPASARTAAISSIVFIVTPSGVGGTYGLRISSKWPR